MSEERALQQALQAIDEWIGPQGPSGVAAAIWRPDRIVAEHASGEARPGVPATAETIFPLASITKPITASAVMTLVEDGSLSLDEPIYRWLPEFRTATAEDGLSPNPELERLRVTITARQLLSHVSGLPEDLGPRQSRHAEPETLEQIVDRYCRLPLLSEPSGELRYSNAGYGIASRLAERVSGREFWALTEARVLEPLGLRDTVVRPDASLLPRFALLADTAHAGTQVEAYNSDYWRQLAIPWGGAYGTPRDLARFAGAFLAGGPRLLSAAAARAMTTDQTEGVPGGVESAKVWWPSGRWGLGWEVKGPKRRHWTGELTSPRTFCHFGAAGTLLWADPERDVALAVFANRMVARMWSFILPRWARLSNAVAAAVS